MKKSKSEKSPRLAITGDGNIVGNHNSATVIKTKVVEKVTITQFVKLLDELNDKLDASTLDNDTKRILKNDVDEVKKQTLSSKPIPSVINSKLKSIEAIIEGARLAVSVITLVPLIEKALTWAKTMF